MKVTKMEYNENDLFAEPVYTIGHAANKLGIAITTLRMYETVGLVIPYRTLTKRRLYSRQDIERVKDIKELLKKHRLNIEAIKRFAALIPCWEVKKCPIEMRRNCSAYSESVKPCWLLPGAMCKQPSYDCRNCDFYKTCLQIIKDPKDLLKIHIKRK